MALKYIGLWYAVLSLVVLSSPCISKPTERRKTSDLNSPNLQSKADETSTVIKALHQTHHGEASTLTKALHQTHHGKLIIGRSSRQDDVRAERKATNKSLTIKDDYQADMGWEEPELVGFIEKENNLEVDQLLKMEPKVECTGSSMRLKVAEGASSRGSIVFVDRGKDLSPLPLSKLPPSCGYTTKSALKNLVLVAPYDGCFVTQEEDHYVLPLHWSGMQVKMSCPTIRQFASNPPMVTCHDEGMVLKIEWVIAVKNIKVNLNGHWEPLMTVSSKCGFSIVAHPEGVVLSVRYAPCLEIKEGMFTLELAGEGEIQVSCPSNLISGSKSPKQPKIEMDAAFPSYPGGSHSFNNVASQTLYTQAPVDGLWYPNVPPSQVLQGIHGQLTDSGKQENLFGPNLVSSTVQHHASNVTQQPEQGIPAVLIGEAQLPSNPYSFYPRPLQPNTLLSEKLSEEGPQTRELHGDQDKQPVNVHPFYTQMANTDVPASERTHYIISSENQDPTEKAGYAFSTVPLYLWPSTHDAPSLPSQPVPQTAPVYVAQTPESGGEHLFFPYTLHGQATQNEMLPKSPSDNMASLGQGHFLPYSLNPTYGQEAGLPSNQTPSEMGVVHLAQGGQEEQPFHSYQVSQLPTQGSDVQQASYFDSFYTSPDGAQVPAKEASPVGVHQFFFPYESGPSAHAPSSDRHEPSMQLQNAQILTQPGLTYPSSSVYQYLGFPQQPLNPEATTHPLTKETTPVAQAPIDQIYQPHYLYPFYTNQPQVPMPESDTVGLFDKIKGSMNESQDYPPIPFYPNLVYADLAQGPGSLPYQPGTQTESVPQYPTTNVFNIQVHEPTYSHPFNSQLQYPGLVNQPMEKTSPSTAAPSGQIPQLSYPFYHQQSQGELAQDPRTLLYQPSAQTESVPQSPTTNVLNIQVHEPTYSHPFDSQLQYPGLNQAVEMTSPSSGTGTQVLQAVDNTSTHLEYPYSNPLYLGPVYSQQPSKLESERDPSKHSVKKPGPPNGAPTNPLHLYISSSSHQPQGTKDSANLPGHDSQKNDQATGHQRYQQSQSAASLLPGSADVAGLVIPGAIASQQGTSLLCPQICPTGFVNCCPPSISYHQHFHHIVPYNSANINSGIPFYTGHPFLSKYSAFPQADAKTLEVNTPPEKNSQKSGHKSQSGSQQPHEIPLYFQSGPITPIGSDYQKDTQPQISTAPSGQYSLPHSLWSYKRINSEGQQAAEQPSAYLFAQSQDFSSSPSISQAPVSDPVQPYYIYDFQMKDTPPNEEHIAKAVQPAAQGLGTNQQTNGPLATSLVPYHTLHNPDPKGHGEPPNHELHKHSSSLSSAGDLQKPVITKTNSSMHQYLEPQGYVLLQHGPPVSDAKSPNAPSGPSTPVHDQNVRSSNLLWLLTGNTQQPQDLGKEITGSYSSSSL